MRKILFFLLITTSVFSQRKIPYPIIFIHGLGNDDGPWINNLRFLQSYGLNVDIDNNRYSGDGGAGTGSRLDFCLNADNDKTRSYLNRKGGEGGKYGDVQEYANRIDSNNDVFVVNFGDEICKGNNESAIVKQGFAVGLAVKKVLEITQANSVILVGHSMGGLAIREYITNREDWINKYGRHCVAHVVTIGTPHGGSDMTSVGIFPVEDSEAVRDLRTKYLGTGNQCAYLFGGLESSYYMRPVLLAFDNVDVNCNGIINESIIGLNDRPLPDDITYICIIGNGVDEEKLKLQGDGVVTIKSQNLFTYQRPSSLYNTITIKAIHSLSAKNYLWFGKREQDFTLEIFQAIQFAYIYGQVEIPLNKSFTGAFVNRANESNNFSNTYKFFVFKGGKLKLHANNPYGFHNIQVVNRDKSEIIIPYVNGDDREYTLPIGGNYMIIFTSKFFTRGVQEYNFQTKYCQFPDAPVFEANTTSICQGGQAVLTAPMGFDSYIWFRDGTEIQKGVVNSTKVDQSGVYSMQAYGCGTNVISYNQIQISVKPSPDKPTVTVTSAGLQSSSVTGNQWYLDGQAIQGANQQVLTTYDSGNYSVKVTNLGCSNESAPFVITSTEDDYAKVQFYPNPSDGKIYLNLANEKQILRIVDFSGRIMVNKEIIPDKSPYPIDISYLSSGEYILQAITLNSVKTFKILIESNK